MSKFQYNNSLYRDKEYYDNTNRVIRSVTFNIGRYGETQHTLSFPADVTEKEAIEEVEAYLSQPLKKEEYQKLVEKGDIFGGDDWEDVKDWYTIKGRCLGDAKFLENILYTSDSSITLECGS